MISIKIWETPLSWRAKYFLPVSVRVSKARLLKLPVVEGTPTRVDTAGEKKVTSKNNTSQNTTRTTHNNSVRQQVLLPTKETDSRSGRRPLNSTKKLHSQPITIEILVNPFTFTHSVRERGPWERVGTSPRCAFASRYQ